jgi:putative N6-adenine-specific DNA methylase
LPSAGRPAPSPAAKYFVITAPGLEQLAAAELTALGITPASTEPGGVSFDGPHGTMYRANLHLRTASRVVARVGELDARHFTDLERAVKRQPWREALSAELPVRLRVTCRKSRLYHSDAVAERIAAAIAHALGAAPAKAGADDDDATDEDAQLVIARLLHDRCTLSVDTSGALLHRRGYRLQTAKAPLRETLAAAMLIASGWTGDAPLVDPMCGAGTIPIEGALLARRIAPGARRGFAFMRAPSFDAALWSRMLEKARDRELPRAPAPIVASDRDAGAVAAALANAERAGVAGDVEITRRAISGLAPPSAVHGWLVTNPPYGLRVGERKALRDLYAQLGNVARRRCDGWTVGLLSASAELERQLRMPLEVALRCRNGGVAVRMVVGKVQSTVKSQQSTVVTSSE